MLANLLHIRPWEIDLLTVEQFDRAIAWVDEYDRRSQAQPTGGSDRE